MATTILRHASAKDSGAFHMCRGTAESGEPSPRNGVAVIGQRVFRKSSGPKFTDGESAEADILAMGDGMRHVVKGQDGSYKTGASRCFHGGYVVTICDWKLN